MEWKLKLVTILRIYSNKLDIGIQYAWQFYVVQSIVVFDLFGVFVFVFVFVCLFVFNLFGFVVFVCLFVF